MSTPKRHHYLPQFYLKHFCRDGGLWVFDRDCNEYRQQTPKNTALKQHYYTAETASGEKSTEIEELLSLVEGQAKVVIDKLVSRQAITDEEKEELSVFVAFMMNRVPSFEKSANEMHEKLIRRMGELMFADEARVQSMMDERERETGEKPGVSAKELVTFYKDGEFEIEIHRNQSLRLMLSLSVDLANYFRQMNWGIFHAPPRSAFITTDNPFVLLPPDNWKPSIYGYGILTRGTRKVLPLTPEACLVMFDRGNRLFHHNIDSSTARGTNLAVARHSDRFVIARDEAHLRHVVRASRVEELDPIRLFSIA